MLETFYETVEGLQAALDAYLIHYETERPHLVQALLRLERVQGAEAAAKELVVKPHVVGCDAKIDDLIQNRPYEAIIVDAGILRQRECRAWNLPNVQT